MTEARKKALKHIDYLLDKVMELKELSPEGTKKFRTFAGRITPDVNKGDYDSLRNKLRTEEVVDISDVSTGTSWGENQAEITVADWTKLMTYHSKVKDELSGAQTSETPANAKSLDLLHPTIAQKCATLYTSKNYPEAVEKGFKVVRDRLRELTGHEKALEAFGKGGLYIQGATAENVDDDFQQAAKFMMTSIDFFRNEKSHTSDGKLDAIRAYEYLSMSSLAMRLLENTELKEKTEKKSEKPKKETQEQIPPGKKRIELSAIQILALRVFGTLGDKRLLSSAHMGGSELVAFDKSSNPALLEELYKLDTQEVVAHLEELADYGILKISFNSRGAPIYGVTKEGYGAISQVEKQFKQ